MVNWLLLSVALLGIFGQGDGHGLCDDMPEECFCEGGCVLDYAYFMHTPAIEGVEVCAVANAVLGGGYVCVCTETLFDVFSSDSPSPFHRTVRALAAIQYSHACETTVVNEAMQIAALDVLEVCRNSGPHLARVSTEVLDELEDYALRLRTGPRRKCVGFFGSADSSIASSSGNPSSSVEEEENNNGGVLSPSDWEIVLYVFFAFIGIILLCMVVYMCTTTLGVRTSEVYFRRNIFLN